MPVWAAVLLPIVTGVIGVAGGLYGTWLGVAQSAAQERRRILGDAAGDFAKAIGGASHAMSYALDAASREGPLNDAEQFVGEAANPAARVELLFEDATGEAARGTRRELRAAIAALRAGNVADARAAYERAEAARSEFQRQARGAIWQGERRTGIRRLLPH